MLLFEVCCYLRYVVICGKLWHVIYGMLLCVDDIRRMLLLMLLL